MKKILIFLIPSIIFANIFETKFEAHITEKSNKYTKTYNIKYNIDKINIEILGPEINKGEIYTYENNKKYIYYPQLKQTVEQTLTTADNDIIKLLEEIKNVKTTTKKDNKEYIVKDGLVRTIKTNMYNIKIDYDNKDRPINIILKNGVDTVEYIWKY